jgi:crotonobetaine/carnitine-CoA ligase
MTRIGLRHREVSPFSGWDMQVLLDDQARRRGDHPFLKWEGFTGPGKVWSYREFAEDTARLAGGLAKRGVGNGDFVLVHMENCPEFLLAWFACARLGAVAVTTNTRSAGEELNYYADNANAVAAITQPKFADLVAANCPDIKWLAVSATDSDGNPGEATTHDLRFDDLYGQAADVPPRPIDPSAPLCVMYTSGTTSRPKGVVWSHSNGLWASRGSAFHEGLMPTDIQLVMLPLFHMNAMSCQILSTLWVGGTVILQPRFSASRFWEVATRNRCTWTSLVPFCVAALDGQEVPEHDFRVWGAGVNGVYDDRFSVRSLGWWGMTETVTVGIVGSVYHDDSKFTLGRPSPLYEIAILDGQGNGVLPGETGDLRIRGIPGVSLFDHYLNNMEVTESSFDELGFFMTGDRCRLNADGTISFQDRSKDMLKVGGENVAASEVERVIMGVPGVAEVAVVAKPDRMLNEVPVAFIIAKSGVDHGALQEQIASDCSRALADFKQPREVRLVDTLPRSTVEKIAKAKLRDELAAEYDAALSEGNVS